MIRVRFFASLREQVGQDSVEVPADGSLSVSELIGRLTAQLGAAAGAALTAESVRVAVNQEIIRGNADIGPNDEVAFLPPVTGG